MKSMIVVFLALLLTAPEVPAAEPEDDMAAWEIASLSIIKRGRKLSRGFALYMTDSRGPSLGFSCHREQLYAFVSVVPQSLGDVLRKSFRNPAEWRASYRVDDDRERSEKWIWTYNGKVFMSLPDDSSNYLLKAASRGARLEFQRKGGDPVNIGIPAVDERRLERFIEKCGLMPASFDSITT